jgi:hypothetical protein
LIIINVLLLMVKLLRLKSAKSAVKIDRTFFEQATN